MILSENNPHYQFNLIKNVNNPDYYKNKITTLFILKGDVNLEVDNSKINLKENEGIVFSQNSKIKTINNSSNSEILEVISNKKTENLVEKIDNGRSIIENQITNFKLLKNHKKVSKPWGHELWLVWLKDYHVLKQIFMKKNNKCSLQYHKEKYETNYLSSGKALVIKDLHIDLKKSEKEIKEFVKKKDLFKNFSKEVNTQQSFTNVPGEVHRVYSKESYIAYEVSTPELDDVIRISDDTERKSGRIISEHDDFDVLRQIHKNPKVSQRELAKNLDYSIGKINYCLKSLVEKGFIKMGNFSRSKSKINYIYILTPRGLKRKAKLTMRFMKRKMVEYEELKKELQNTLDH